MTTPTPNTGPVEPKVTVASVTAGVVVAVLGFVAQYVELDPSISVALTGLITAGIAFGVGYVKRTATKVLRERLLSQEKILP